ncbi:delta 1-pyrroline-5-carboxylate dehydrogenase [Enterovibrio sp. ZSDZ35]|uniref:Delta 1-pyrroline-5-carboxylate dehydrogenase n=1 Tax=Enterovibrio qingdaonensis TaxID=2899818 RepID=A0ABT5QJP8_9GAMM|nr:delta 1-pyrroline-5-carboxylate dehydrogenase [Enterovibrio sp. ZSDZ35]MDD1781222.1 delta 1-pyrroline-5-carboxylate dehydrogenase [Enterovibrio sp. ZSDZ35]
MTVNNDMIERTSAQSLAVWDAWNTLNVEVRCDVLLGWADAITQRGKAFNEAAQLIRFHAQCARDLIAPVHEMPGPTGETNELYTAGRGLFIVSGDSSLTLTAMAGQLAAALVAGNCVLLIVTKEMAHSADALLADFVKVSSHDRVVQILSETYLNAAIAHAPISGVAVVADDATLIAWNKKLAERDGVLVQFVAEDNVEQLSLIASPTYLLRFITERTRTINITAVGGNATLLELGSGEH